MNIAYLNNPEIKKQVLQELKHHYDADNFIKGKYWENGKGCAVGCLLKNDDHTQYETLYGIPVYLARLEDTIFEGLPNDKDKEWPIKFMSSFEVGKDYSNVTNDFMYWLLMAYLLPKIKGEGKIYDDVREALKKSASVLKCNGVADAARAAAAYDAARAVAAACDAAAAYAYNAAHDVAYAAARAAYAAARAARDADAAAYAAADAARAAAAYAYDAAHDVAYAAAYEDFSKKLIELIRNA